MVILNVREFFVPAAFFYDNLGASQVTPTSSPASKSKQQATELAQILQIMSADRKADREHQAAQAALDREAIQQQMRETLAASMGPINALLGPIAQVLVSVLQAQHPPENQ